MSSAALMTHRCTIQRNIPQDVSGKVTAVWSDAATGVPCLIQEGGGRWQSRGEGSVQQYDAIGFFSINSGLQPRGTAPLHDVILLTEPPWLAGNRYQVLHCADESGRGDHLTAYLKLVGPKEA